MDLHSLFDILRKNARASSIISIKLGIGQCN